MYEMFKRNFDYYVDRIENGKFDEIDLVLFKENLERIKEISTNFSNLCGEYEDFYLYEIEKI